MKKIFLSLFLLIGFLFGGSVYGYSIEEGNKTIENLKIELEKYNYTFERVSYMEEDDEIDKYYNIYFDEKLLYGIYNSDKGISLDYNNESDVNSLSTSRVFSNEDFPLGHILYYFDEYKDRSKVINGIISKIELGYNNSIKVFPGENKKYYLNIRYLGYDSQSFLQNDHLVTKYILKNNCYELTKDKQNYKFTEEEREKCISDSILEHYIDSKITIKIKESPEFIKLKKDDKGIDYFEINLESNKYSDIGNYPLEFEVFLNGQEKGFNKKMEIKVLKPIILAIGELGPDGGTVFNNWKDIGVSIKKGLLNEKYKIAYIANDEGVFIFKTGKELSKDSDGNFIDYYFNINAPSSDLIHANYLSGKTYWTTININQGNTDGYINNVTNTEIKKYNTCVKDDKKSDSDKYICFKEYMGFLNTNVDTNNNKSKLIKQLIVSKNNLKNNDKMVKYITKFEKLIPDLSNDRLENLNGKISNLSLKIRSNKTYKDILDYIEAKVGLEIIKRK